MGLLDSLNSPTGALATAMQSPLFNLGMGLIGGAQPFQNPGQQLMGAAANQQQMAMHQYQLRMLRQQMPLYMSILSRLGGMMGAPQKPAKGSKAQSQAAGQAAATAPAAPAPSAVSAPVVGPFSALPSAPQAAPAPQPQMGGGGMNPQNLMSAGILASAVPMTAPLGKALMQGAQFGAQYSPQIQAQLAYAKSAVGQAQAAYQQAVASGNQDAIRGAEVQLLTAQHRLQMAAWSGNVSAVGVSPQQLASLGISTFNPQQGTQTTNGVASVIPGMVPARQALAGATARGEAQGQVQRVWDPQTNQWSYVPRSALLGGQSAPGASATGSAPLMAAPSPQLSAYMEGTGEQGARSVATLQQAADAAQRSNFNLAQILAASQGVVTGPSAGARKWVDNATSALTQWFGVQPPASLASYQELDKYANQLAFAASRQLGSREAGQIVELERQSNPNKASVPAALRDLVGAAHAANDYVISQNAYVQRVAQRNGGNALYAQANFTSNADPRVWELAISPDLAAKWAPRIGTAKIAKVMPYMLPDTAYAAFRNLSRASQRALVRVLDPQVMQEMVNSATGR
jgi:hypothetical protein